MKYFDCVLCCLGNYNSNVVFAWSKKKLGHKNVKEKVKSIICLIGCTNNQYDKPVRYINGHSCYCGGLYHSLLVCFYKNLLLLGK